MEWFQHEGDLKLKIATGICQLFGIIARKAIKIYQIIRKWKFTFLYEMINRGDACFRLYLNIGSAYNKV